jgi:domain of unknown function (DUF1707)
MLQKAYDDGQLSRDQYEDRKWFCLSARYADDLSDLISDLPGGAMWRREEPSDEPPERVIITDNPLPYSNTVVLRRKTVRMAPDMTTIRSFAVMGNSVIHIEDIMAPGVVIEIFLKSLLGTFTVYVPWRTQIIDRSRVLMSMIEVDPDAPGDGANGTLIINGWHILGTLNIRLEKYLKEERDERRRIRAERLRLFQEDRRRYYADRIREAEAEGKLRRRRRL